MPKNDPVLHRLASSRAPYYVGRDQFLEYEVEMALTRVLE